MKKERKKKNRFIIHDGILSDVLSTNSIHIEEEKNETDQCLHIPYQTVLKIHLAIAHYRLMKNHMIGMMLLFDFYLQRYYNKFFS